MSVEKSCGCIVFDGGRVLMIGAREDGEGKMFYGFPKGHQEHGETDLETALRETKEEVGLEVEIVDETPVKTGYFVKNGTVWKNIYLFLAKPKDTETKRQETEVEEIIWVDFEEVEKWLKMNNKIGYYLEAWKEARGRILKAIKGAKA